MHDCVVPFHLEIDLLEAPFYVDIITWNESTTYAHALTVCFFLDPPEKGVYELEKLKENLIDG